MRSAHSVARLSAQVMLRVSGRWFASTAIRLCMAALNATQTTSPGAARALRTASRMAVSTARWISSGSCSAAAGVGVSSGYSTAWWATTRPSVSNTTALVLVVPISTPMTTAVASVMRVSWSVAQAMNRPIAKTTAKPTSATNVSITVQDRSVSFTSSPK